MESDHAVPYQLDGDPGGVLPLEITVDPRCLTLMVDQSWHG
jgi:diacylglycerol kinase family enzyme